MGNACQQGEKCPQHPKEQFKFICMYTRCIEPLCSQCLPAHYAQHKDVGASPDIHSIESIKKKLEKSMEAERTSYAETEELHSAVKEIYPAEYIKELTREYFIRKRTHNKKDVSLPELLQNVELSHQFLQDPSIRQKFMAFLKENTTANLGVLSHEYSYLY